MFLWSLACVSLETMLANFWPHRKKEQVKAALGAAGLLAPRAGDWRPGTTFLVFGSTGALSWPLMCSSKLAFLRKVLPHLGQTIGSLSVWTKSL